MRYCVLVQNRAAEQVDDMAALPVAVAAVASNRVGLTILAGAHLLSLVFGPMVLFPSAGDAGLF